MDRAVDKFLYDHSSDDDAQLALWPDDAVSLLLFTCNKDPSVRIRRAAMSLLTSVVSKQQSGQEQAIVHALVLKCRDKDAKVQSQAYQMMVQLPAETLAAHLLIEEWRAVLDTALLSMQGVSTEQDQHRKEVQRLGSELLHKYLGFKQVLQALPADFMSPAGIHIELLEHTDALDAVGQASQYLQALQLPWHNNAVYLAYSAALSDCTHCHGSTTQDHA